MFDETVAVAADINLLSCTDIHYRTNAGLSSNFILHKLDIKIGMCGRKDC